MSWRCHTCGEVFKAWAPAQRHVDTHGGGRIECIFEIRNEGGSGLRR